jgi:hypothetical protein
MAFRSAAYAVVARIFKLIDSNGFTRLLFGPWIPTLGLDPGYSIDYFSPNWSDPDKATGIAFTPDGPGDPDSAQTLLYSRPHANPDEGSVVYARSFDDGFFPFVAAGAYAQNDTGGFANLSAIADMDAPAVGRGASTTVEASQSNGANPPRVASVQLNAQNAFADVHIAASDINTGAECSIDLNTPAGGPSLVSIDTTFLNVNNVSPWSSIFGMTIPLFGPVVPAAAFPFTNIATMDLGVSTVRRSITISFGSLMVIGGGFTDIYVMLNNVAQFRVRTAGGTFSRVGQWVFNRAAGSANVFELRIADAGGGFAVNNAGGGDLNFFQAYITRAGA